MQLNKQGQFTADATVYKENKQWVIRLEGLPDWLMETIKEEYGNGFDPYIENHIEKPQVLVLVGRYYPG